jgi:integrase
MARDKRGFGTIRKLPSGRYQALYTTTAGQRVTAPNTFAARIDAEAFLTDRRREVELGKHNPAAVRRPKHLFSDYTENWLRDRHVGGRPIRPRTRQHYRALLDDHILPTFGARSLAAITADDVKRWHNTTLVNRPTLRSHAYSLLRSIMASAERDELIAANPCRIVGAGSAKRAKLIRPASVEELAVIVDVMPERLQLMVLLSSWCALRFGEVVELRRRDVSLDGDPVIRVRRAAYRVNGGYEIGEPKSAAGARDVDIPPHLIPVIEAHLDKFVADEPNALLFPSQNGEHLQPSTVSRHFYKARAIANRDDLRWHDLRHTGATMAAVTGASLAELMQRLGHSTPTAAMRYQHASRSRGREIAALLSKLAENA